MAANAKTGRGNVQRETYDRVRALLSSNDGLKTREAFERVAAESGRSVGTVQTSYYRIAREDPNSGVKSRPRKPRAVKGSDGNVPANGRRRGRPAGTGSADLDKLIANYLDAQAELLAYVKQMSRERKDLDRIRELLAG
jgi:hypothetical protein